MTSCGGDGKKKLMTREEMSEKGFTELFRQIEPAEIDESVFKLVGEDFTVITSGGISDYNSMVASWGGWGILFNNPVTWCFLRANRYTLEYIKANGTYTMCYFDDPYKEDIMIFGAKSGRDTDKMEEHPMLAVATPGGGVAYKEAKLIIECRITGLTTVSPDDFYTAEGREFIEGGFAEAQDFHKLVFGDITSVWVKK